MTVTWKNITLCCSLLYIVIFWNRLSL